MFLPKNVIHHGFNYISNNLIDLMNWIIFYFISVMPKSFARSIKLIWRSSLLSSSITSKSQYQGFQNGVLGGSVAKIFTPTCPTAHVSMGEKMATAHGCLVLKIAKKGSSPRHMLLNSQKSCCQGVELGAKSAVLAVGTTALGLVQLFLFKSIFKIEIVIF